jgi:cytochrome oxidase assembly protein ShyY1
LEDLLGPDDPFQGNGVGRPVTTSGHWLPAGTVLVSGRLQHGQEGFWQVVPLLTCGSAATGCPEPSAIPVVVGWSASSEGLPPPPTGSADVVGWLQPGEAEAGPDDNPDDDVIPALRVADLLQRVDQDLYGGFVILRTPAAARAGLEAVTPDSLPEAPTSTALRNLLYGIEWWLFGGFAVFLWWRWTRDEVQAARAKDAGVTPLSADADDGATAVEARIPSKP